MPTQHLLGFIRGAARFGGCLNSIRASLEREFPQLSPMQVEVLLDGAIEWLPQQQRQRILS